ncbi:MAG: peptidoglycan DD-metalloendopeptidase family protein [Rhizobiaceae bacterium]
MQNASAKRKPATSGQGSRRALLNMSVEAKIKASLGGENPLMGGNGRRAPDKRRVSIRWMTGSVLTGLSSLLLMGGALYAALDGRQQLAKPADFLDKLTAGDAAVGRAVKGDRPVTVLALKPARERIFQVPTVTRVGEDDVIRKRPFAFVSAPLAVAPQRKVSYPRFNPLTVFRASGVDTAVGSTDVIYGADVEGEVRIQQVAFPLNTADFDKTTQISEQEAEAIVREVRATLDDGELQVGALPYLDNTRFALKEEEIAPTTGLNIRIVAENVSTVPLGEADILPGRHFTEDVIEVAGKQTLEEALAGLQLEPAPLDDMLVALKGDLGKGALPDGTKLRVAFEQIGNTEQENQLREARRISVYRSGEHIRSVALNDNGSVVWAATPAPIPAVVEADDGEPEIARVTSSNLPNLYDGMYRAALSQGLGVNQARRMVRTAAFDVDFRKVIKPDDGLEVFMTIEDGLNETSENSEILYFGLTVSGKKRRYYRFHSGKEGRVDYYDESGKSAKKFLLRKPVPNGRFSSSFGMRRHPISRVVKMHQGVDFAAPRGTPIIAAGDGVVQSARWNAGYGRQTIIRHANGYKTSYSHQHRFSKGIRPGARVRQGQIIGLVGSTGYSTGPHLHYEVIVNGRKVNPTKIRLPKGRVLSGEALVAFKQERDRIDALVAKVNGEEQTVASLN